MIRFYNANILMPDFSIKTGEVHTDGNKISYVGDPKQTDLNFETTVNLNGNLIMPAFKNAHTHSAMTFLRSYADDLPLQQWLFEKIFPMEAKLTPEDVYTLTKLAYAEYLTSGISACFDMYFYPESVSQAAIDTGFRTIMCGSVSGSDSKADIDSALSRLEKFYNTYKNFDKHGLVSYALGFHAEYTTSRPIMEGIAALAEQYKAPVSVHNSETAAEVAGCIERYGKTPTEIFCEIGIYKYGGAGFHCVHMTDNDLNLMKDRGCYVVTNPASNAKLASGIARLSDMSQMGVNLSIGTDGPSSNNALDFFREMYLACVLQKLLKNDAAAMPAEIILKAAFDGGAMGLNNANTIEAGNLADLTVIDLNQPNMQPQNAIVKNIVYSGSKQNIILTMINGKILYKDGEFMTLDTEKLYKEANGIIRRMANDNTNIQ
ncbi:MAG: amidohydrolase [Ruminococcus sp.]|jgi:5-methylthioadenosine/S-adenosylhomocysteine deaminase|nr:amidohydrolase [Ruminococcus sp.]